MKWLSNINISTRLIVGFSSAIVSMIIIILLGLNSLTTIKESIYDLNADKYKKTVLINDLIDVINAIGKEIRDMVIISDASQLSHKKQKIDELTEKAASTLASIKPMLKTDKAKELYAGIIDVRLNRYVPARKQLTAYLDNNDNESAKAFLRQEMFQAEEEYFKRLYGMLTLLTEQMNESAIGAEELTASTKTLLLTLVIGISVLLIIFSIIMIRSITKPLEILKSRIYQLQTACITNLGNSLVSMSEGDFSQKVKKETQTLNLEQRDEIGEIGSTLDKMILQVHSGIDAYDVVREKVKDLSDETGILIRDAKEGKLDSRGNSEKFKGGYKDIVKGINDILDETIRPVQESAKALEIMSTGDLTVRVNTVYKGQHQDIVNSINSLGESLSNLLHKINEAVYATVSSSTEISSSTEQMAAGAQEQSSQTGEVATAIEQMTKTIVETTQNATAAAENARNAGKIADEGGKVVEETVSGIEQISQVVSQSAETVKQLGKNSDEIGEIVQVIDDIADQTNLLALNAAIEAARAGEQGRGFAVVADEVRKLAERTTKATKEIADMIKQIQKDTVEAVNSMNKGTDQVEKGKALAKKAGDSLKAIINASTKVVDDITQVATASEEQSSTAEQITRSIEGINNVTQESAAGIEQVAKAAEDLNKLTDNLQSLISKFKIDIDSIRENHHFEKTAKKNHSREGSLRKSSIREYANV